MLKLILLVVIFLWFSTFAMCQNHTLQIQKFGLEDGLSSYNISKIVQDPKGYIWIATDYGLNRYDGVEFKTYTKEESGLCGNKIYNLAIDKLGHLWISADNNNQGCNSIFDPIQEKFFSLDEYFSTPLPFAPNTVGFYNSPYKKTILLKKYVLAEDRIVFYEHDGQQFHELYKQFDLKKEYPKHSEMHSFKIAPDRYVVSLTLNPAY
ncbi:MAG: hypothetical protein GY810_02070 [Aureispira sp.]|nr:hypothetical protein [Aureispira sp.]